jgi:hypothetical protein
MSRNIMLENSILDRMEELLEEGYPEDLAAAMSVEEHNEREPDFED